MTQGLQLLFVTHNDPPKATYIGFVAFDTLQLTTPQIG